VLVSASVGITLIIKILIRMSSLLNCIEVSMQFYLHANFAENDWVLCSNVCALLVIVLGESSPASVTGNTRKPDWANDLKWRRRAPPRRTRGGYSEGEGFHERISNAS
jgi:hypothetical protein